MPQSTELQVRPLDRDASMQVGLDLPSCDPMAFGLDEPRFRWPTPYTLYLAANRSIRAAVMDSDRFNNLTDICQASYAAVASQIERDAMRLVKIALDISHARRDGIDLIFDSNESKLAHILYEADMHRASPSECVASMEPSKDLGLNDQGRSLDFLRRMRTSAAMALRSGVGRFDLHTNSPLLDELFAAQDLKPTLLRPESWSWPGTGDCNTSLVALARDLGGELHAIATDLECGQTLANSVGAMLEHIAGRYLRQAYLMADHLQCRVGTRRLGSHLVGGSPKALGRLLNWHYSRAGRHVWRFAHGGDRAFFVDAVWSASEFPYVEQFCAHGAGEAEAIRTRFERGSMPHIAGPIPRTVTFGSHRHQRIWRLCHDRPTTGLRYGSAPKIILVAGSFLGEAKMGTIETRLPDQLVADSQAQLIRILLKRGYEVVVKAHPKGVFTKSPPQIAWGADVVQGQFDPTAQDADCFLFDYAGSAFFDALASNKGVVLLNTPNRQIDPTTRDDLFMRCQVVEARFDAFNRLRVDPDELVEAVEVARANNGCPESFARRYFWPSAELG